MSSTPIAITGIGAVSALGIGIEAHAEAMAQGRSGIGSPRHLVPIAPPPQVGEVDMTNTALAALAGVDADRSRTALLALVAAGEALRMAGGPATDRMALISASTVGGMDRSEHHAAAWIGGDMGRSHIATGHQVGDHAMQLAEHVGAGGMVTTLSTACSSSANALMMATSLLRAGIADVVLAGGSDALCRFTVEGFRSLSAMDPLPCRPFSQDRAGMNLGEAAAYLVLERSADALARGARPLAMLAGGANTNDAHHQTATSPTGEGPYLAITQALRLAGLHAGEVDLINAHGTGTDNNDITEQTAMERVFAHMPPFTSTKSATGHTLAAAGALEAVLSILSIRDGLLPATLRWSTPIEGMRSAPVTAPSRGVVRTVLSTSFGFGGNDSALILTAP